MSPSMSRLLRIALLVVVALVATQYWRSPDVAGGAAELQERGHDASTTSQANDGLPPEAQQTLAAIARGGPFRYDRDGTVFQNREGLLPSRPRGYYREYTVVTPGSPDRGARRVVTGGDPPEVYYYTDDHYRSFRSIEVRVDEQ